MNHLNTNEKHHKKHKNITKVYHLLKGHNTYNLQEKMQSDIFIQNRTVKKVFVRTFFWSGYESYKTFFFFFL